MEQARQHRSLAPLLLVGAVSLLVLTLPPASAQGAKVIDRYCSPTGDYCQYVVRKQRKIRLEMRQFPLRGKYKLCVKPPRANFTCKKFRWRRSGPILKSVVTFSRHFPSKRKGRYKVTWRTVDGNKIGKTLYFRKVGVSQLAKVGVSQLAGSAALAVSGFLLLGPPPELASSDLEPS